MAPRIDKPKARRRIKKRFRNQRRRGLAEDGRRELTATSNALIRMQRLTGSVSATDRACVGSGGDEGRFFVPDRSSFYAEVGEIELFRFFESIHGPGAPSGRLADGRPYVQMTDVSESECCDHYLIDPSGLESATTAELEALLRRSEVAWPTWADGEVRVRVARVNDDRGRPTLDIEVRYSCTDPDEDL